MIHDRINVEITHIDKYSVVVTGNYIRKSSFLIAQRWAILCAKTIKCCRSCCKSCMHLTLFIAFFAIQLTRHNGELQMSTERFTIGE